MYVGEVAPAGGRKTVQVAREARGNQERPEGAPSGKARTDTIQAVTRSRALSPSHEFLVRVLDVVGAVAILTIALPAMLVVALLIRILSSGSVLYTQKRVGRGGRVFTLYKFRTMINNAEEHTGPIWAAKEDSRVTPIGRFLRCTRLDEFPQLFNVLRGDMSLVGPRPERPYFVQRHKALQGVRLAVRPGLTGLAQIRSFYDLKPTHKMKYDYLYIQKRSFLLNTYIILQTIPVLFTKKGW
jgi:lipopolysaccharide/colanic/teichoic acid biosynthesis glycosyltransferase